MLSWVNAPGTSPERATPYRWTESEDYRCCLLYKRIFIKPLHFPHFLHFSPKAGKGGLCGKCRKCNGPMHLFIPFFIGSVLDMPEETALEPVLERPLAYLVRLGNLYALAGFEGNRQFVVDGPLLLREA